MKAILHIVLILVAGVGAYLTISQTNKFATLQQVRLKTIADNKIVTANAAVKESELKAEKAVQVAAEQKREEITQRVSASEAQGATLQRQSNELDATLKTQEQELAELAKTLTEVNSIVAGLGGDVTLENLPDKMQELEATKKDKQAKLEEGTLLISAADKSLAGHRAVIDDFTKRMVVRNSHIGRNSMEAVVIAVNQDWGFLVIGAGSNSGFTPQSSLLVMRDGRLLGRVHPSAIEPSQTIAEIDFKSLAAGVRLQPGDRVMLTKTNAN